MKTPVELCGTDSVNGVLHVAARLPAMCPGGVEFSAVERPAWGFLKLTVRAS